MLHIIIPILVGAVIGYFTNYIAIRMLFRPRRAVMLGKWRLPFTPGVIPKNQERIADSVGKAIEEQLLTADDLAEKLGSSSVKGEFADAVTAALCRNEKSIHDLMPRLSEDYRVKDYLSRTLTGGILDTVNETDLVPIIRGISQIAFGDLLSNPMVGLFLREDKLEELYGKAEQSFRSYLSGNCRGIVDDYLDRKMPGFLERPIRDHIASAKLDEDMVHGAAEAVFDKVLSTYVPVLISRLNIRQIVSDKIRAMDVKELEKLVMSVMKQELQAVVNLGAIIGAVIGVINIFI